MALVELGDDTAGKVGDGDPDPLTADVDTEHVARGGIGLVDHSGATLTGEAAADRVHEVDLFQVEQGLADGRFGEAGVLGDLWPGGGSEVAQPIEHGPLVEFAHASGSTDLGRAACRHGTCLRHELRQVYFGPFLTAVGYVRKLSELVEGGAP